MSIPQGPFAGLAASARAKRETEDRNAHLLALAKQLKQCSEDLFSLHEYRRGAEILDVVEKIRRTLVTQD